MTTHIAGTRPIDDETCATCFACGRGYCKGAPKADDSGPSRFCSVRCRDVFDAGFLPYETPAAVYSLPMSGGGFVIECKECRREFASKGLRCCSNECERKYRDKEEIADTLAAVGVGQSAKRRCEGCGAGLPRWRKGRAVPKNTRFCSDRCSQKARRLSGASTPVLKPDSARKAALNGLCRKEVNCRGGAHERTRHRAAAPRIDQAPAG